MVGVLRMEWRSGRCCYEGYAELQVTVFRRHGGMRGGTGVRIVGIPTTCSSTGEPYCGGNAESHGGTGVSP